MKKLTIISLIILIVFMLSGCGDDKPVQVAVGTTAPGVQTTAPTGATEPANTAGESAGADETIGATEGIATQPPSPNATVNLEEENEQALDDLNDALKDLDNAIKEADDMLNEIDNLE